MFGAIDCGNAATFEKLPVVFVPGDRKAHGYKYSRGSHHSPWSPTTRTSGYRLSTSSMETQAIPISLVPIGPQYRSEFGTLVVPGRYPVSVVLNSILRTKISRYW